MFVRSRFALCAEQDAPVGGGTPTNAAVGAGTVDVNELVNVVVGKRVKKEIERLTASLPELIQTAVKGAMGPGIQTDKQPPVADGGADEKERLNLKALQSQLNDLNQQLKKSREEAETERQRAIDSQMRSEVQTALAGALGADNPNLGLVMDSLYDTRKRFVRGEDGQTLVKFKSDLGGDEDLHPLKEGLKKLVDGELKHMLPAKTQNLPAVGRGRNGTPVPTNGTSTKNPLDAIFSNVIAQASAAAADPNQK